MKTVKFLTAFAMASMLVACVEDLAPVEKNKQVMDEVVGAEIIGTDVSMNIPVVGVETKFAGGEADWDSQDKLGLGWIVAGAIGEPQSDEDVPTSNTLYANHLFTVNANDVFESRGNIYKGWHFAYFPYNYMDEVGEMELSLNPAQTVNLVAEDGINLNQTNYHKRLAQKFHVSSLQFLTKDALLVDEGYMVKPEIDFKPVTPLAELTFSITPVEGSAFATDPKLKEYKIKTISLRFPSGARFATEATFAPSALNRYANVLPEEFKDVDIKDYNKGLLKGTFEAAITAERTKSITLDVSEAGYKVGSKAIGVAYTLPYYGPGKLNAFNMKNAVITVSTDKGDFTIRYVIPEEGQELTAWEAVNNKAIEKLVAAYDTFDDPATKEDESGVMRRSEGQLTMKLQLHEDLFGQDWTVDSEDKWAEKVELAKSLNLETVDFVIPGGTEIVFSGAVPALTEGTINVKSDSDKMTYLVFEEGTTEWSNENIKLVSKVGIKVGKDAVLDIQADLTATQLYNEGKILVAEGVTVKTSNKKISNDGTIEVSLGSVITNSASAEVGDVVFEVAADNVKAADLKTLIEKTRLSRLVITRDLTLPSDVDMSNVSFEVKDNAVVTSEVAVNVGGLTMYGGSIGIVNVNGTVTVESGVNFIEGNVDGDVIVGKEAIVETKAAVATPTATLTAIEITGTLTVHAGAEATLKAPEDEFLTIRIVKNSGNLNVEGTNVYVDTITTTPGSMTYIPEDKAIYYKVSYANNGGTTTGKIGDVDESDGYEHTEDYDLIEGKYYVKSTKGFQEVMSSKDVEQITAVLNEDVTYGLNMTEFQYVLGTEKTTSIIIDGNGHTITFDQTNGKGFTSYENDIYNYIKGANDNLVLEINNATVVKVNAGSVDQFYHNVKFACEAKFTDVRFETAVNVMNDATFENVTITNTEDAYALWIQPLGQTVELKGQNHINSSIGCGIKIERSRACGEVTGVNLTVAGTEFITSYKAAILVNAPANVNWLSGDFSKTIDKTNAVWVDEDAISADVMKIKVEGCSMISESDFKPAE